MSDATADVLVVFGITGDLAKVMTFRSLYRLEKRGLLDCPIVGVAVDDWTVDQLVQRARESIVGTGEQLDEDVFKRLAARFSYVSGDFGDDATYARVGEGDRGRRAARSSTSRSRRSCSGASSRASHDAGLTANARVVVEKPFGHDRDSAHALAAELHQYIDESQLYRIDHYLGKMGLEEILHLRFANAMLEPVWSRNYLVERRDHDGGGLRRRGPRPLLRSGRRAARRRRQPPDAGGRRRRDGGARRAATRRRSRTRRSRSSARSRRPIRPTTCAASTTATASIDGVAADSTTETYAALRLEIENWRWAGVPFFIRTGKRLPVTQTELRLVFQPPAAARLRRVRRALEPNQLVVKLDPTTGIQLLVEAHRADASRAGTIELDMEFAEEGGEGPTPYEVLLHAALVGDTTRFTRQDGVEETWRIMQPLLDAPPPVHPYAPGSWGPKEADELVAGYGKWHGPWIVQ